MDKRFMLALGVSSIWGSAESVYALAQQDRLIEDRQHVRIKPSLSTKQAKRDSKGRLKLSINLKGGKSPSSQQSLKSKKLSRKEARAAKKKFSLALKASRKKGVSSLIQTKKQARIIAKRNRKAALRMKQIERKRLQFRKTWEKQEARLQTKKSRLLKRNPVLLKKQKLPEQVAPKRLITPAPTLVLRAPDMRKKTVLPKPLLKTVAAKKAEEMQTRLKKANDSLNQSVLRKLPLENRISPVRDELNAANEQQIPLLKAASLENRISLVRDELNAANEQHAPLPLLSLGEYQYRDAGMHVGVANDDREVENINYAPHQSASKGVTLEELELTSENLAPVLRDFTGKLWDLVEETSRIVSPASQRSLDLLEKITTFADVMNEIAQYLNPSISHKNALMYEGGYDWESLIDDEILDPYPYEKILTPEKQVKQDLKINDDLKKDKPFSPLAAEESDDDMVIHATKMETLEERIAQFQSAASQLREKVERDGADQLEENKMELRRVLNAGYMIEATLPYLRLNASESTAESINDLLKSHEESVGGEKVRLSLALKTLLELEGQSNMTSSLSQPPQAVDKQEKEVGLSVLSAAALPEIHRDESVPTGTPTLGQKDIETEDQSSLASKSVGIDSAELSARPFPSLLGSLNALLEDLDKIDLKSKNLPSNYGVIKLHSSWLKDKLLSIESGNENKSSISIESKEEGSYDFAADMRDLSAKISHYLTLALPSSDWLLNFKINSGKGNAVELIKEVTNLKKQLAEEASSSPSQQPPVAAAAQPSWWDYLPKPFSAKPAVTPSPQDPSNGDSGTPPQDPSNGSKSSDNNDKD